jgi:hypothetical protein
MTNTTRAHRSALALTLLGLVASLPAEAAETVLVDFELEDQFGNVHRRADVEGTIVLLIGSDKGGSSFNGLWGDAIREALGNHPHYGQISQLAYSDLRGVPFFVKNTVRSKFPEDPENWVLMDWKGVLAKTYAFERKNSNILVFDSTGQLMQHASGREPDERKLDETVAILRALLDELAIGDS